ncbi:MAG: xanthine dehydrogenase family protein molybdopterin-binding subunit [Thermoleophilia bacterium]
MTDAPAGKNVGSRQRKLKGDLFLTGRATYFNDITVPNVAHAAVKRSPHAHARIVSIDTSRAAAAPGVLAVLVGEEAKELHNPIPYFIDPAVFGGKSPPVYCLAVGKVKYWGQPVAAVVAETPGDAQAALDLIDVQYEVLEPVVDADRALEPGSPRVNDDWDDNLVIEIPFVEGDCDAAFDGAEHVIEGEFRMGRNSTQPIETRGNLAVWAPDGSLTFYGAIQNPHPLRMHLSQTLGIPETKIRVIAPNVGGGLGLKMHGHPEETLVCVLAKRIGRPVKWLEDRRETLLIGGIENVQRYKIAFDSTGRITALQNRIVANVGNLTSAPGWGMAFLMGLSYPTGYKVANTDVGVKVVTTNKGVWNAIRGYGKQGTNPVMERMVDAIAHRLGLDPVEVRRRNLIEKHEFPYPTNSGLNIDSGDYHGALDKICEWLDYDNLRAEQQRLLEEEGRYMGIGLVFELTPESADIPGTIVGGFDTCTVKMDPQGNVTVLTGVTSPGSGNETGIAQIVADELGVDVEGISVIQGDTDSCPYGFGNYSGRSMVTGGGSAVLASRDVADKLKKTAAILLEAGESDVQLVNGMASVVGAPEKAIPIPQVAFTVYTLNFAIPGIPEAPLEATRVYKPQNIRHTPDEKGRIQPYPTYSFAVHAAVVEVDVETGKTTFQRIGCVHDCGTMINPTLIEGQMAGALVMGIGHGISEEIRYDDQGVNQSNRLKTYLLPRAGDVTSIEMIHQVTPSPFTILGNKGAGEAGVGGGMGLVLSAVNDAIRPLGAAVESLPVTPETVLRAIRAAGHGPGATQPNWPHA